MQWLRLRPESPEELDAVDWRGRWIDEDDEYDDDEDEEDEEDRHMEDFDPVGLPTSHRRSGSDAFGLQDAVEGDEDDDDEEEEEEEGGGDARTQGQQNPNKGRVTQHPPGATYIQSLRSSAPSQSARTSPTSSGAPRTPLASPTTKPSASVVSTASSSPLAGPGKVKMVRQWTPRMETLARTAKV